MPYIHIISVSSSKQSHAGLLPNHFSKVDMENDLFCN